VSRSSAILSFFLIAALLALLVFFPVIDLWVSGLFGDADRGFPWNEAWPLLALNKIAFYGARLLGFVFLAGLLAALVKRGACCGVSSRAWLFLFLALLIGPGLVANVVFKDHWGRARPREIVAFGGKATFTPPLVRTDQCATNCSFVSGDGAFGFFLPTIAYVVPRRRRRRAFRWLLSLGCLFGAARIVAGAHFLSDVLFAAFFMFLTSAILYVLMFGKKQALEIWEDWIQGKEKD
jgi:lipid A 4'-phosphatase